MAKSKQIETVEQSPTRPKFISDAAIEAAMASHAKWRAPASVMLGQYILESGAGRVQPAHSNNGLGIQALHGRAWVESPSHEMVGGKLVPVMERFAVFKDEADMFDAYGELMATGAPYRVAMLYAANAEMFAAHLQRYSTTDGYTGILIGTMRKYNLEQFDVMPPPVSVIPTEQITEITTVRLLQVALNKLGADPTLVVDGLFGEHTRDAVERFQQSAGLDTDGIPGPLTKAAIVAKLRENG